MERPYAFAFVVAGAILMGCDTLAGPSESDPPLQTDRPEYTLHRADGALTTEIPFTYTNTTGHAVFVVNCNQSAPPTLEKRIEGRWETAWTPIVLLCLSLPIVIEPGETYADTLRVNGADPASDMYPRFRVEEVEGTYRLVWPLVLYNYDPDRQGFGDKLALKDRISNTFTLTLE